MNYYIYQHVRLDKDEIFYIGKGTKCNRGNIYKRAFTKNSRNTYWKNITQSTSYRVDILEEYESEKECLERETQLIKLYGYSWNNTGTLCNIVEDNESIRRLATLNSIRSNSKEVYQYDLEGNYIKSFSSIAAAKKEYQCDIYNAVSGRAPTAGNFQWRLNKYEKIESYSRELSRINKSKTIYQYDIDDNLIDKWKSSKEASIALKINTGAIRNCLCGIASTAGNFKWSYFELPKDNNIKKYSVYKNGELIFSSNKLKTCAEHLGFTPESVSVYMRRKHEYKGYMFKCNKMKK